MNLFFLLLFVNGRLKKELKKKYIDFTKRVYDVQRTHKKKKN